MQSKVCRTSPILKQSKDQRFHTRKNHAKKNGGSARSIWRSAQSFAPKHKLQAVATTHIFLRNDGNNLLTHKLEEK